MLLLYFKEVKMFLKISKIGRFTKKEVNCFTADWVTSKPVIHPFLNISVSNHRDTISGNVFLGLRLFKGISS